MRLPVPCVERRPEVDEFDPERVASEKDLSEPWTRVTAFEINCDPLLRDPTTPRHSYHAALEEERRHRVPDVRHVQSHRRQADMRVEAAGTNQRAGDLDLKRAVDHGDRDGA